MLDYAATHFIKSMVELIRVDHVNETYEHVHRSYKYGVTRLLHTYFKMISRTKDALP